MDIKLRNKIKHYIKGNFVSSLVYIFQYGFKYKKTKRILFTTLIGTLIFYIAYLYLLAVGRYEDNILVRIFTVYPFKGSMILMALPISSILYSIKKTIEIEMVSDRIMEEEGDKHSYKFSEKNSEEILELMDNIIKLKDRYEVAVEHTLKNERLKTELISNVSHDLRTPLTSIINYVNILGQEGITDEERKEYLLILEQKSKKLKVLIDDLFEMSKINSGKVEVNKEKIDIMSLIHQAIGEYSYLYEDKNIEFNVESFDEEIYMLLDGKMISRAFENIVINGLKYSLENTRIYVKVKNKGNMIEIVFKNVANYFMNFDEDEMFERFARGDNSRNSNVEGSGLGLAITKSIIDLHGGEVKIKRDGDMFKIYIDLPKELI